MIERFSFARFAIVEYLLIDKSSGIPGTKSYTKTNGRQRILSVGRN